MRRGIAPSRESCDTCLCLRRAAIETPGPRSAKHPTCSHCRPQPGPEHARRRLRTESSGMPMRLKLLCFVPLTLALALLVACSYDTAPTGPAEHESRSIPLDKAEMVRVSLRMGAGDLEVRGGAPDLVDADFTYNVPSWKPDLRYNYTGVRGDLTIEQPGSSHAHTGNTAYSWKLRFNDSVPLDFAVNFGAGKGDLNLGSLSLRSLDVDMGVGELILDLRGEPKRDYNVRIRGGVGDATVYLPRNVGVYADAAGGIGGIDVRGLRKEQGHYVNDAYETSKVKIDLSVRGGIGAIHLID